MKRSLFIPAPRQLNSGAWNIQLRLDGRSISITRQTAEECRREALLVKAEHLNNIKSAPSGGNIPLKDALERYIVSRENVLSPSTCRGYRIIQRTRFQSVMNRPLSSIQWQKVINAEAAIASPKTIKNAFGLIGSVYRENDLELPPVRLPAPEVKERAFLSPEEIPAFISACRGNRHEIGMLLALSGLRRSEIYGLQWSDVNLAAGTIYIHQSAVQNAARETVIRSKNKNVSSTRRIPIMIPALREALEAVQDKSGAVVTGSLDTLNGAVRRVCEKNDLTLVSLHGLRHSFASLCYSLGVPELQCQRLGGWSDYQTMRKIYTHISENDAKKTDEKLVNFFRNANENANGL